MVSDNGSLNTGFYELKLIRCSMKSWHFKHFVWRRTWNVSTKWYTSFTDRTAPIKLGQTQKQNTPLETKQTKISKWIYCQSHTAKYREAPSFGKLYCLWGFVWQTNWTNKACLFAIQNLITWIEISLHASRYFGVWLWQLVHLLILVCSFQWCVLFLCLAKLYSRPVLSVITVNSFFKAFSVPYQLQSFVVYFV